jgi:hypothetical protein
MYEKIIISKDIAESIGLEESVLLAVIEEHCRTVNNDNFNVGSISQDIPFWDEDKFLKVLSSLSSKGLVSQSVDIKNQLKLTNRNPGLEKANTFTEFDPNSRTKELITGSWEPEREILDQALEYGIPEDFTKLQIGDFKHISSEKNEKNHSWGVKFLRFVIKKWRENEILVHKQNKRHPIPKNWFPENEACEILINSGIPNTFIEEEIPEFVLYWSERKEISDIWNSKFIAHMRRQWFRSKNVTENNEKVELITSAWKPNEDLFQVLSLTDISRDFAEKNIGEFILYWKETGQAHNSWNSKFLQHLKYQWQKHQSNEVAIDDINKRIDTTWNTEIKVNKQTAPLEETKANFQKLKTKHQF